MEWSQRGRRIARVSALAGLLVSAIGLGAPATASTGPTPTAGQYTIGPTTRLYDSRTAPAGKFAAGETRQLLTGNTYVNIFTEAATSLGGIAVHPCSQAADASRLDVVAVPNQSMANLVAVRAGGPYCVTATVATHIIIDAVATVDGVGDRFVSLIGSVSERPVSAGGTVSVTVAGVAGVPVNATAVSMFVQGVSAEAGYLNVYPTGGSVPAVAQAMVNGTGAGNVVLVPVGTNGSINIFSFGNATVRTTPLGYFVPSAGTISVPATLTFPNSAKLQSVTPSRSVDTRTTSRLAAGGRFRLLVNNPAATVAVINVTVVNPQGDGYITAYPCDQPAPQASNLNYVKGQTVANLIVATIAESTRDVCLTTYAATDLLVDFAGYYVFGASATGGFDPVDPRRLLDTRQVGSGARVSAGQEVAIDIPGGALTAAAALNLTATSTGADGYLTAYPCGTERPTVSNLNYTANQTVANAAIVKVGANGKVCVYTYADAHVIVDLNGTFASAGADSLRGLTPNRLLDTRIGVGAPAAHVAADSEVALTVTSDPAVKAVVLNVTAVIPTGDGFVTAYPCGTTRPTVSNLNYAAGQVVPNLVTVKVGTGGKVCLYSYAETDLLADLLAVYV